ncbi:RNA polymerase sigma factor [Spongiactinospora rosea]|uniref:RNA polymerase sigma factor n=1 Tax=Spongiactinospora rosea TaxID=2248750 RepID=UPI0011C02710|nr:sigma-70 family RNA polymerase sigma factor [Spongiactinospora rosea]
MPGWPNTGRADDHLLVEALRRADAHAPADLYDAYGERLYDYACSRLPHPEAAAEAVHNALVTACEAVDRLGDSRRLRAWVYALTRHQCLARPRRRTGTPPLAAPVPEDDEDEIDDPELAELVFEVLGELAPGDREVLELAVRHALGDAEVAAVLGLTTRQIAARVGRARDLLELAAAAVVLARVGRAHCPDLSAMVDSLEGPLPPLLRKRLSAHIGGCEICHELRHRHVSAERLLAAVPIGYPPLSLRHRVIDTCANPDREQTRREIAKRTERFDKAGFPLPAERRSRRRPRRLTALVITASCVLAATVAVVVVNGTAEPAGVRAAPAPSPSVFTPGAEPTAADEAPGDPLEEETEEPEETAEPPTPSAAPTPAPRRTTRPATASPSASRRPPAVSARLAVSCPADLGASGAGLIQLAARGSAVSWNASVSGEMGLSARRGRLAAGKGASVWITVEDPGEPGDGQVSIRSNGGSRTCAVSWPGQDVEAPEPPRDTPEPPGPEPSESAPAPSPQDGGVAQSD